MVCTACGYENQVGNRFCGMCGTPLPHAPLTAPGAQGTHNLTRVPVESANPAESARVSVPLEEAGVAGPPSRGGMLFEMPGAKPQLPEDTLPSAVDMVPEIPLDEYIKSFRYNPPADPKEVTMRGEAETLRLQASAVPDGAVAVPTEVASSADETPISPAEDVRERLGLKDSLTGDERRDRPRFLDFSDPARPLEKPETPESAVEGPTFLETGDTTVQLSAQPKAEAESDKPSNGRGLTWVAAAALIAFAALGVLERRSQVNHTNNGPVEVIKTRLLEIKKRFNPPQTADSTDGTSGKPAAQVGQPQSAPADQNLPANPNAPSVAPANGSPPTDANAGNNAGSPPPNTTSPTETPLPAGQKAVSAVQSSSVTGTQAATDQKADQPKPAALAPAKVAKAEAAGVTQTAAEKPKPKPQPAQGDNEESAVKKLVPGAEELDKANNASDAAAAAAWLWKATAKGNPDAPVRLADLYVKGDGVPRSCEQALVLLKTAATKENVLARNRLAGMYSSGTCVQRNRVEAYRWVSSALAVDPNSHWAQQNRDSIWQQMTPEERAAAQQYR